MVFKHTETGKDALYLTKYNPSLGEPSPTMIRVRKSEDMPPTKDMAHIYDKLDIPIEIWKGQGQKGLHCYFRAFFTDKEAEKDFWFWLLPSGFPGGVIPTT